jgi:acetyl esterase
MALPVKVRVLDAVQGALQRVGVLPSYEKVLTMPHAKRLGFGPGKGLVGRLAPVETEDHTVTTRDGASIRVRVYRSADATRQPLLYIHGGGFVVGGIDSCDHICRRLAFESGAVVASVEYRLAPDHRFPGPLHDCLDALDWLLQRDVDGSSLVVAGDSGGGNLAAAVAVVLRDQARPLAGQLLIYPAVDLSLSLPGIHAYRGVGLTADDCRLCADAYLGGHNPTDPYASPWYADPEGLAPAFVFTATHDCLRHEGIAYAQKLREAGVPVTHVDLDHHSHGSLSLPRLFRGIDDLYGEMTAFVKAAAVRTG